MELQSLPERSRKHGEEGKLYFGQAPPEVCPIRPPLLFVFLILLRTLQAHKLDLLVAVLLDPHHHSVSRSHHQDMELCLMTTTNTY